MLEVQYLEKYGSNNIKDYVIILLFCNSGMITQTLIVQPVSEDILQDLLQGGGGGGVQGVLLSFVPPPPLRI